jgi:hypothetical protein
MHLSRFVPEDLDEGSFMNSDDEDEDANPKHSKM